MLKNVLSDLDKDNAILEGLFIEFVRADSEDDIT